MKVLCVNPRGPGDLHGVRMRLLASHLDAEIEFHDMDRSLSRRAAFGRLWSVLRSSQWDLIYQEGTGIAAGLAAIRAARSWKQPYIVSSGDPIAGFFRVTQGPIAGRAFGVYERALYRHSAGFVGWTPYLTGMALMLGAPRGATVEGGADLRLFTPRSAKERECLKLQFGLDPSHLVCGVVGSLRWNMRHRYCYGLEMVEMLKRVRRADVSLLIVGDGDGRSRLAEALPAALRHRVVFTGRLPAECVPDAAAAMDIGFVTQTLDELGSFRLTTKLPEYLASGVPVAMSPIPGFYDYAGEAGWALPAHHPADARMHAGCAAWLDRLSWTEVTAKAAMARPVAEQRFDYERLGERFRRFVEEITRGS